MEIRFVPIPPPQSVRAPVDVRPRLEETEGRNPLATRERENQGAPPVAAPGAGRTDRPNAAEAPPRAARAEVPRVRIQPELPNGTRNALELFARNSFSEEEDPAASLDRIDVFV